MSTVVKGIRYPAEAYEHVGPSCTDVRTLLYYGGAVWAFFLSTRRLPVQRARAQEELRGLRAVPFVQVSLRSVARCHIC